MGAGFDKKHPQYRKCKSAEFGMMFGQSPAGCAENNGIPLEEAEAFHIGHRRLYKTYWNWADWRIHRAYSERRIQTPYGFYLNVHRNTSRNTLLNWPMQATCAEILRLATTRMLDEGLSILLTVHDAVLIESADEDIERDVEIAKECWRWAGERVVKYPMASDAKIFHSGQRFHDDDGQEEWETIIRLLEEVEREDGVQIEMFQEASIG